MTDAEDAEVDAADAAVRGESPRTSDARRTVTVVILVVALAAATLLLWWPAIGNDFVNWDDLTLVVRNPYLSGKTEDLAHLWRAPYEGLYTPMAYTLWWALAKVGAESPPTPGLFHGANVVLHVACAVLVFALLRTLTASPWAAAAGALVFAMHPVQVEAVAWVSGMNNVLCGAFALTAVWLYILCIKPRPSAATDGAAPGRGFMRAVFYSAATIAFVLALLSKPIAVVLPLVALALDVGLVRHSLRRAIGSLLLWFLLAVPFVIVARHVQPSASIAPAAPWARPLVALDALAFYLSELFAPVHLIPDYGRTPTRIMEQGAILWTWLAPAALALACWLWRRRAPWLVTGALVFVAATLPVLGLTVFEFQNYSTVADRYIYVAMLGPSLVVAFALARARHPATFAAAALVVGVLAFQTRAQIHVWRDTDTLFAHVLRVNPSSLAAHKVFTFALEREGKFSESLEHAESALRLTPADVQLNFHVGNLLAFRLGRPQDALAYYERALDGWPANPKIHNNAGVALLHTGRSGEGARQFERALRLDPRYPDPHVNLGLLYAESGDLAAADAHFRAALALDPDLAAARQGLARIRELRDGTRHD